ncbi:hypothetical protein, partial [Nocardioides sp.]|uniref:hypothetical protein n=1 Tax=Nocardioides sp. TaxID=35761 RepID=UPI002ED7E1B3
VLLLSVTDGLVVGVVALVVVGAGTSLTTARVIPRFLDATPEPMLARFSSLLHLAQVAPVLAVTPVLGVAAHGWGVRAPMVALSVTLLATAAAVRRADAALSPAPGGSRSPVRAASG